MAEAFAAVGLAASIVTFVDVSSKVLARLREFHLISQGAPGVFRDIKARLPLMIDIMTRIKKRSLLDSLIEKMLPTSTDSPLRRARKAIVSVRKEKDLAAIQSTLRRYEGTLTLYFSERSVASTAITQGGNTYYVTPSLQVLQFVERVELLEEIEASFATVGNISHPKIVVLLGMGGQGKTQLALEYCRAVRTSGKFQAIFWIDASSSNTVSRGPETIAAKISSPGRLFDDIESEIAFVKETLGQWRSPWLMIFDNYDQPSEFRDITSYIPRGKTGAVLFTSRHPDSERLGVTIRVTRMTEHVGLELLLCQSKLEMNDNNAMEGGKVIQKLGYLPLAIDQAGAYISERRLPLQLFAEHYDERKEVVLKHTPSLWEYRRRLGEDKDEMLLSVFTTWELSFQQIGRMRMNE